MGQGSRIAYKYYATLSLIVFVYSMIDFSIINSISDDCDKKCPLLVYYSGDQGTYAENACMCKPPGKGDDWYKTWDDRSENNQIAIRDDVESYVAETKSRCFVCDSTTSLDLFELCDVPSQCSNSEHLGFKPAEISSGDICVQNATNRFDASLLKSVRVNMRKLSLPGLYVIAILLLLMSIVGMLTTFAFYALKDKNQNDWMKLTWREKIWGFICREGPIVIRVLNAMSFFFIVFGLVLVAIGVCEFARNDYEDVVFYPRVRRFLIGSGGVWGILMVGGTLFHLFCPVDTALANPKQAVIMSQDSSPFHEDEFDTWRGYCYAKTCDLGYLIISVGP